MDAGCLLIGLVLWFAASVPVGVLAGRWIAAANRPSEVRGEH